jgi:hypothetical protein
VKWGRGKQCRISILFPLLATARIDAPPVANDEHHQASHVFRTLPMNKNWTSSSLFLSNFRIFAAVKDRRYKREK